MLEQGSLLEGKYRIKHIIDTGGMSVVYLAVDEKLNQLRAVKEVRKDGTKDLELITRRLMAEKEILKKLKHPNLPQIFDVINEDGTYIIVMTLVEGISLDKVLNQKGPQPEEYVADWAIQMCNVFGYLHNLTPPIIYRDTKPSNIMWTSDPTGDTPGKVTLIDFGTAKEFKGVNIADTTSLGTIGYAAPEQLVLGNVSDARTDIYNLGATMFNLLTGKVVGSPDMSILAVNKAFSHSLDRIIRKCTQREKEARYQSVAELKADILHYREEESTDRKKMWQKVAIFASACLLTVALGLVSLWGFAGAEREMNNNYEYMLQSAREPQDYYKVILMDPTRTEAYTKLNKHLVEDYKLTQAEGAMLIQLMTGLNAESSNGFQEIVQVLERLEKSEPERYQQVCFEIGWSFVSFYETGMDYDRYSNATMWFENVRTLDTENGRIADVFCRIFECTDRIRQIHGSLIPQTEGLKEQRQKLWDEVHALLDLAQHHTDDYCVQVWIEVDNLISRNLTDFLAVVEPQELVDLLRDIQSEAQSMEGRNPDLASRIQVLVSNIDETVAKLGSLMD